MRRSDGVRVKSNDAFMEIIPYIMERRSDSQNFAKQIFMTEPIERYLREKRAEGVRIDYMHLFIATYVRLMHERRHLNRFVMNRRVYQRDKVWISMAIKRSFREDGEETTVKFEFTGEETIFEVAEIVNRTIAEAKAEGTSTEQDKIIKRIMSLPVFVKKFLVRTLKRMDEWNMLPASIILASPFHTSLFFTHLKSIKTDFIYHHLYDFGTTGFFVALGKIIKKPMVVDNEVVVKHCVQVGYTIDERICDGVYLARSLRRLEELIAKPELLEARPMTK